MTPNNRTINSRDAHTFHAGPIAIDTERHGDVCVLRCQGCFFAGLDADYIRSKVEDIRQLKCTKVLMDVKEVPSIGSTGIAFIVGIYTSVVRTAGGRFVLAGAAPLVQRVLEITRLSTIIPLAEDFGSGLEALRA